MKLILFGLLLAALCVPPPSQAGEKPLRLCLISGATEYESDRSLALLQKHLEKQGRVTCKRAFATSESNLPGLEQLDDCDCAVLFTRRLKLEGDQLARFKRYCLSGKPLVGIRTASHAVQTWLDLDREVLGGDYQNHYPEGPETEVSVVTAARAHPVLAGVQGFASKGSLYKNPALAKDAQVLLRGSNPGHSEPVAWVRSYKGGRIFYTSLGHQRDFDEPNFLRLLTNAIYWSAGRAAP